MSLEVVHEQVVCVVNKEVQCVNHLSVIANQGHFDCLVYDLDNRLFCLVFLLEQFDLHLLLRLFHQEVCFSDQLLRSLDCLVNLLCRV